MMARNEGYPDESIVRFAKASTSFALYLESSNQVLFGPYKDQILPVPTNGEEVYLPEKKGCDKCRAAYFNRIPWDRLPQNKCTAAVVHAFETDACEAYRVAQVYVGFCRNTCQLANMMSSKRWVKNDRSRRFVRLSETDPEDIDRLDMIVLPHSSKSVPWDNSLLPENKLPHYDQSLSLDGLFSLCYGFIERSGLQREKIGVAQDKIEIGYSDEYNENIFAEVEILRHGLEDILDGWQNLYDGFDSKARDSLSVMKMSEEEVDQFFDAENVL